MTVTSTSHVSGDADDVQEGAAGHDRLSPWASAANPAQRLAEATSTNRQ